MHLCSTTKLPWYVSHQSSAYIHTSSILVRLHDTNKVGVTEVLETSRFVFYIQTCDQFHHVIKVTTQFCSPSQFSRWLPLFRCPPLHILLFPLCKPPISINQLTVIIESLRASVNLIATYLIWLAIKPKPTNDFTIYMEVLPKALQYLQLGCSRNSCVYSFRVLHHIWYCLLCKLTTLHFSILIYPPYFQLCMSCYVLYTLVPSKYRTVSTPQPWK